jgi:hypothetical protein
VYFKHVWKGHNKIHCKKCTKQSSGIKSNRGVSMTKVYVMHAWKYHKEPPHCIINVLIKCEDGIIKKMKTIFIQNI